MDCRWFIVRSLFRESHCAQFLGAQRARRNFTLIELLIVLAIFSILLSLLLRSLVSAQTQAKIVLCKGNLSKLGYASTQVLEDNRGRGVPYANQGFPVDKYVDNKEDGTDREDGIKFCPEAPWISTPNNTSGVDAKKPYCWNLAGRARSSYTINAWTYASDFGGHYASKSIDMSNGTYKNPLFADGRWVDGQPNNTDTILPSYIPNGNNGVAIGRFTLYRHGNGINVLFYDGHSEFVEALLVNRLMWHR